MGRNLTDFWSSQGAAKASSTPASGSKPDTKKDTKSRGKRKVLSDSEEEDAGEAVPDQLDHASSSKPPSHREKRPATGIETTKSAYFSSKSRAARSAKTDDKDGVAEADPHATPRAKVSTAVNDEDPMEVDTPPKSRSHRNSAKSTRHQPETATNGDQITKGTTQGGSARKRKASPLPVESPSVAVKRGRPSTKSTPSKDTSKPVKRKAGQKQKSEDEEDLEVQEILNNVPTVRAPTPPPRDPTQKFDFKANAGHAQAAHGAGSSELPTGAPNCLSGLTFVFTGILESLSREEGQELVKRYGGKVTTTPSSKTSFVVLGTEAGPKKLETIAQNKLKTINEEGLFALIRTLPADGGNSKTAVKAREKRIKEEGKAETAAKQMAEEMDRQTDSAARPAANGTAPNAGDHRLWTVKYAPTQLNQICGNKSQVERLQTWLRNWRRNAQSGFKKGGPDGSGLYRAVMIHGGPGIGKTTAAHLVAKLEGYDVLESNASDTRSKQLVESGLKSVLDAKSLSGYFAGDGKAVDARKQNLVLIMDEVDGMSAGDRGGVGAMAAICRKTNVPVILICNERKLPKMKPFDHVTFDLPFRKPTTDQVRSRISTILYREGMRDAIPKSSVDALIEGAGADIRRVINMISTAKLDQTAMDFDDSKRMVRSWEKNIVLKPWDNVHKILGSGLFAPSSKATLGDKIELYFNDHDFSPLMLQENYLFAQPALARDLQGKKKDIKTLQLVDEAASSISDGDLVDAMIHGTQQQWSLMPAHAVFSFVRPASFVAGGLGGNRMQFTSWLGNNSKGGKNARLLKEIQSHMRLRAPGDRHDIREQYLPLLWYRLIKGLELHGSEPGGVEAIIELMDSYYLTKDDWDAIKDLGIGIQASDQVDIPAAVKSVFTRKYNAVSHPVPYMKPGIGAPAAQKRTDKPDLEEALEASDDDVAVNAASSEDEAVDLKKDKYVQAPKKKKAPAAKKKAGAAGKNAGADDSSDEEGRDSASGRATGKRGGGRGGSRRGRGGASRGRGK